MRVSKHNNNVRKFVAFAIIKMEKNSQYFEGILQLRNPNKEILDFAVNLVEEREGVEIMQKEKVTNGFDLYLTSQKFLQTIGKKLKNHFHGELKISRKLHTRNRITAKEVYRVNVLFRMPKFKKGDVIDYRGDKIKIVGIGKRILAKNLETGKKLTFNFKDL